jgi:hypothetical protein
VADPPHVAWNKTAHEAVLPAAIMFLAIKASEKMGSCTAAHGEAKQMPKNHVSKDLTRANRALDAANFFLADVRDGLGPYLAIYLLTVQKWDEASIGVVMSIATAAGILAQTPAGAFIDATRAKRIIVAVAALMVAAASLLLPWVQNFPAVTISQATAHAAAAIFAPALAAIPGYRRARGLYQAYRPQ